MNIHEEVRASNMVHWMGRQSDTEKVLMAIRRLSSRNLTQSLDFSNPTPVSIGELRFETSRFKEVKGEGVEWIVATLEAVGILEYNPELRRIKMRKDF